MKYTKKNIEEIIDSDGNIIGSEDKPEMSPDIETQASKTTDYNAKVHGQNFKNDFLGRFGFYFYESKEGAEKLKSDLSLIMYEKFLDTLEYYHNNPDKLTSDYEKHFRNNLDKDNNIDTNDIKWANKVLDVIEPHLKKSLNENVSEDKISKSKDDKSVTKKDKDNDVIDKKTKKVAELLNNLSDNEIDKLINILESKKNK